jgi:tRNA/rRNA methyltransferase
MLLFSNLPRRRKNYAAQAAELRAGSPRSACPGRACRLEQGRIFVENEMPSDTPQPAFVLVRPQMGENIGAAARAMWNFGLDRMRIVAPRDGWPNPKAVAMSSGAGRLLDEAQLCADVPGALADCSFVFATTARQRGMTKPVYSPEAAMQLAAEKIAAGEKVAVMFGPERAGLENDDIAKANAIISVPVNPLYASLNLGQCCLLTAYEWMRQSAEVEHVVTELGKTDWATGTDIEKLSEHYEGRLDEAGCFFPPEKAPNMKTNLRNLWSRMPLTKADVQMMHGVLRQMVRWKERGNG